MRRSCGSTSVEKMTVATGSATYKTHTVARFGLLEPSCEGAEPVVLVGSEVEVMINDVISREERFYREFYVLSQETRTHRYRN